MIFALVSVALVCLAIGIAIGVYLALDLHERGTAVQDAERQARRVWDKLEAEPGFNEQMDAAIASLDAGQCVAFDTSSGFGDQTYGPAVEARYSGDGTPL
jgi:hypothetical protein